MQTGGVVYYYYYDYPTGSVRSGGNNAARCMNGYQLITEHADFSTTGAGKFIGNYVSEN